jgi:hypothetical protein
MSLWGNVDNAANSTIYAAAQGNKTPNTANRTTLFQNTTVGAFVTNIALGQFGVSAAEAANTAGEGKKVPHAGWNLRVQGTGPLGTVTVGTAGSGYANSDTFIVVAGSGGVNATGNLVTNATGNVVSTSLTSSGSGFTSVTPTVTITTAAGTNAVLSATAGGRAGRVQYETLVAMGSQDDGSADDTLLPQ